MKILFLLNPSKSNHLWDLREEAAQAARRHGVTARFAQIDRQTPDSLTRQLGQGVEEGCRRVVAVGGDGTLNRTLNALRHQRWLTKLDVALVPAGTCNDFAKNFGWKPKRLAEAFEVACHGSSQLTDLGLMTLGTTETVFLNNAGFGRRVQVSSQRRTSTFQTLRQFQTTGLRAKWEKGQVEGQFFMLLACNAPFFSNGLYFSKNLRVNDGALDIYLVPAMARWKLVPLLLKGRLRRPVGNKQVLSLRVRHLEIEADRDIFPQADGEPAPQAVRRVTFAIAPEKVMIVVPERSRPVTLWNKPI